MCKSNVKEINSLTIHQNLETSNTSVTSKKVLSHIASFSHIDKGGINRPDVSGYGRTLPGKDLTLGGARDFSFRGGAGSISELNHASSFAPNLEPLAMPSSKKNKGDYAFNNDIGGKNSSFTDSNYFAPI